MDGITNRSSLRFLAAAFAFCGISSPVSADVLEIDGEAAKWVAVAGTAQSAQQQPTDQRRGKAADRLGPVPPKTSSEIPADISVPEDAVADPKKHTVTLPEPYRKQVILLAQRFDISPALLEALVWQESRWRANAVSPAGARGLAQLMPGTAKYLGVDPDDPMQNLEGGARYLREQLDRFEGDVEKALAAYNAGPGRVQRAGGIPRIRETQNYVAAIMGRLSNHSRSSYQ